MEKFKPSKKPLTNDKIVISISMNIDKINEIDKIAGTIDVSRNELINQCIEYALENLNINNEKEGEEKKNNR